MPPAAAVWAGVRPKVMHLPIRCLTSDSHREDNCAVADVELAVDPHLRLKGAHGMAAARRDSRRGALRAKSAMV